MMPDRSELARDFLLTRESAPIYRIPNLNAAEPLGPAAIAIGASVSTKHTANRTDKIRFFMTLPPLESIVYVNTRMVRRPKSMACEEIHVEYST